MLQQRPDGESRGENGEKRALISRKRVKKVDLAVEKYNLPGRELTGIL